MDPTFVPIIRSIIRVVFLAYAYVMNKKLFKSLINYSQNIPIRNISACFFLSLITNMNGFTQSCHLVFSIKQALSISLYVIFFIQLLLGLTLVLFGPPTIM